MNLFACWEAERKKWIQTLKYSVSVSAGHYLTICQLFPIHNYEGIEAHAEQIVKTNTHIWYRLLLLAALVMWLAEVLCPFLYLLWWLFLSYSPVFPIHYVHCCWQNLSSSYCAKFMHSYRRQNLIFRKRNWECCGSRSIKQEHHHCSGSLQEVSWTTHLIHPPAYSSP